MAYRRPTRVEGRLLAQLSAAADLAGSLQSWLQVVLVEPIGDGGMGSLRLQVPDVPRATGHQLAIRSELIFKDADDVDVLVSLYCDANGVPVELDIWKVDYMPVVRFPDELPSARRPPSVSG